MKRLAVAGLLLLPLAGLAGASSETAGAMAPTATAYWVKLGHAVPTVPTGGLLVGDDPGAAINPAQPPQPPVTLPVAPPPVSVPGPQLTGYTAVSAVRILGVSPDAAATLTLTVAQPSVPPAPSVSTLVACPIAAPWAPPIGGVGDISNAPASDCSNAAVGKVASDLSAVSFLLPASFQVSPGEFDVLLQPGQVGVPAPYLVAFDLPGLKSVSAPAGGPVETPPPPPIIDQGSPPPGLTSPGTNQTGEPSKPGAPVLSPVVNSPGVVVTEVPRGSGAPTIALSQPAVFVPKVFDDRSHRIMAVSILFAMALALWWLSGREGRAPKRLGSLAGDPADVPGPERGVGRFRQPRTDRPQRLL